MSEIFWSSNWRENVFRFINDQIVWDNTYEDLSKFSLFYSLWYLLITNFCFLCFTIYIYHLFGRIFFNFDYVIKVLLITEKSLFAWVGTCEISLYWSCPWFSNWIWVIFCFRSRKMRLKSAQYWTTDLSSKYGTGDPTNPVSSVIIKR